MTNGAMPPEFKLTASVAGDNPGNAKPLDDAKPASIPGIGGIPADLLQKLHDFEGVRWHVYKDHLGNLTGGLGHLLKGDELSTYSKGSPLSTAQVVAWAQHDVGAAWEAGQRQAAELGVDDHEFKVALASMSFQNGVYWNTVHKRTWALMQQHRWEEAAMEAADSAWAQQTPTRLHDFQAALRRLANPAPMSPAVKVGGEKQSIVKPPVKADEAHHSPEDIKLVQRKLQEKGLYGSAIDGKEYRTNGTESNTTKGIKNFQHLKKLPVTGVVDEATWVALTGNRKDEATWGQEMIEQARALSEASKSKGWGSDSKGETKNSVPDKGWGSEPKEHAGEGATATGNFVDDKYWRSQLSKGEVKAVNVGDAHCRLVSTEMLLLYLMGEKPEMLAELGLSNTGNLKADVMGLSVMGGDANFLRILEEDKSHREDIKEEVDHYSPEEWLVDHEQAAKAIDYVDSYLQRKVPVLVGVDHTYNRRLGSKSQGSKSKASKTGMGYNEGTTDHFIMLSGIGQDDQGRKYYSFLDPGRKLLGQGSGEANVKNRLVHVGGTRFTAQDTGGHVNEDYHLAMVVIFPADRERFAAERKKNKSSWVS